jgi:excisionase family DNA binding protein
MTTNENLVQEVTALKTKQAARRLSVSEKTIRDLVQRGLLRPNRKTRHLLFPVAELDRFLAEWAPQEKKAACSLGRPSSTTHKGATTL